MKSRYVIIPEDPDASVSLLTGVDFRRPKFTGETWRVQVANDNIKEREHDDPAQYYGYRIVPLSSISTMDA